MQEYPHVPTQAELARFADECAKAVLEEENYEKLQKIVGDAGASHDEVTWALDDTITLLKGKHRKAILPTMARDASSIFGGILAGALLADFPGAVAGGVVGFSSTLGGGESGRLSARLKRLEKARDWWAQQVDKDN